MQSAHEASASKLVVVIDDDPLILDAFGGLLRRWGYRVVAAASDCVALARLAEHRQSPDLIVCDYHLAEGKTGIEAIERMHKLFQTPAFLITGDTAPEHRREAHARGYHVLHKPVEPNTLRAMLNRVFKDVVGPAQ